MHAKSLQLCPVLFNPVDCSPPGSMGFSRQEYWIGLPCPPPWDLPDPEIKLASLTSFELAGELFTISATWEAQHSYEDCLNNAHRALSNCLAWY